jgi:hypothetical protein
MKMRLPLIAGASFIAALIPTAAAQAITIFGLSIPCSQGWDCTLCAGVSVIQGLINFAILIAFPIAALLFGYAGALIMTSAANPSGLKKGIDIFKSVGIGFALVLCGWLIVDTIMHTVIINQNPSYFPNKTWNTVGTCADRTDMTKKSVAELLFGVFQSGSPTPVNSVTCPAGSVSAGSSGCADTVNHVFVQPVGYTCNVGKFDPLTAACVDSSGNFVGVPQGAGTLGTGTLPQAPGDCSSSALSSTWGDAASTMSCIIQGESGCVANKASGVDITSDGNPFSLGLYQINLTQGGPAGNLNFPECSAAVGVSGNLNCTSAFSEKNTSATVVNQSLYNSCVQAASNPACNTAAAQYLYSKGGFTPWSAYKSCH